jgi:hypothetical protein
LRVLRRAAADPHTVFTTLNLEFGNPALVDYMDQLFDFFNSHFNWERTKL